MHFFRNFISDGYLSLTVISLGYTFGIKPGDSATNGACVTNKIPSTIDCDVRFGDDGSLPATQGISLGDAPSYSMPTRKNENPLLKIIALIPN